MEEYFLQLTIINAFLFAIAVSALLRNNQVYSYRVKVINYIFSSTDWPIKLRVYRAVSYSEMVFKFWRSPKSFFPKEWDI